MSAISIVFEDGVLVYSLSFMAMGRFVSFVCWISTSCISLFLAATIALSLQCQVSVHFDGLYYERKSNYSWSETLGCLSYFAWWCWFLYLGQCKHTNLCAESLMVVSLSALCRMEILQSRRVVLIQCILTFWSQMNQGSRYLVQSKSRMLAAHTLPLK